MAIQNLGEYSEHPLFAQNPDLVRVLQVFDKMSDHTSPSKQEEAIRTHLISVATEQGWKVDQDDTGNVAFQVPATSGREDVMPIVLQGHMDMVTFPTDEHLPRRAEIIDKGEGGYGDTDDEKKEKGLWMRTVGEEMTLGADNRIGLSLAVAMMMDSTLEHGPVTILATVDEEAGMTGAKTLDPRLIPETGILLNLDSEEGPAKICIGCAGNADTIASFPIGDREALPEGYTLMDLELSGFPGGHSGVDIHNGRGSAIKSMADLLLLLQKVAGDLRLIKISGGEKRNSIPSMARATIAVPNTALASLDAAVRAFVDELKRGKEVPDPNMTGELLKQHTRKIKISLIPTESVELIGALSADLKARLLSVIANTPTGPFASAELPNVGKLVTLSSNLGLVETTADNIEVTSMTRGANIEELRAKLAEIRTAYVASGGFLKQAEEPTSGWLEDPTRSEAISIVTDAVREAIENVEYMAYHAGLEAGIVAGKARGRMSAVATGPLTVGAHSKRERVELKSIADELRALRAIFARVLNHQVTATA